jgi:hypothetical protein
MKSGLVSGDYIRGSSGSSAAVAAAPVWMLLNSLLGLSIGQAERKEGRRKGGRGIGVSGPDGKDAAETERC